MISFGSWCLSVDRYFLIGECWRLSGGYVSCMAGVGLVMMVASRKISGGLMTVVSLLFGSAIVTAISLVVCVSLMSGDFF